MKHCGRGRSEMSDEKLRPEQLEWIEETQGLVRSLAYGIHRSLPKQVPIDDIIGYGQIGLLQAAKAYRSDFQTSFQTFAYYRIRGAMFDGIGKMAWTSRAAQKRFVAERASHDLMSDADGGGAADEQGDAERAAGWIVRNTERLTVIQMLSSGEDREAEMPLRDDVERPDEQAADNELSNLLKKVLNQLPEIERSLIELTYYQGQSLAEAARRLNRSRSWASRLHSDILQRLARSLHLHDLG